MKKKPVIILACFLGLVLILLGSYYLMVRVDEPEIPEGTRVAVDVKAAGENDFEASNGSWLKKNDKDMWEMQLVGNPYELGLTFGKMAEGLSAEKEAAFVGEIKNRIPSASYLNFLKYMVGWFNRDLDEYAPHEYLLEIYGSSQFMPDEYDYIASKYHRALSYHAAHDIGHALQNMDLVGCTSFAVWGDKSRDSTLLIGRNFDFYFGQPFAEDQIIAFYKPDSGYQFMSVTWACFSGVVSGMNEEGLTVTLNAAKSDIPSKGKTPVSLIARDILQYAANIDEAMAIAEKYESFIAETFLIGSRNDGKVGLIEKTPERTELYLQDNHEIIATNHFQGDSLKTDPLNLDYMEEGVSTYRYDRVSELIDSLRPLAVSDVAQILRDRKGMGGKNLGLGNEMASNQLIAHHSVIFSPMEMMAWVSSPPYQLGEYLAYDLNEIFSETGNGKFTYSPSYSIPPDPFLYSSAYEGYEVFVEVKEKILTFLYQNKAQKITDTEETAFVNSNPKSFLTYYYLGDYHLKLENWAKAKAYFEIGLELDVAKMSERKHMEEGLKTSTQNLGG